MFSGTLETGVHISLVLPTKVMNCHPHEHFVTLASSHEVPKYFASFGGCTFDVHIIDVHNANLPE